MRDDFAIFIVSYKRSNNLLSLDYIKSTNYDGDWYLIVGNDDPELNNYKNNIPKENLIIFDKKEQDLYLKNNNYAFKTDNFNDYNHAIYVMNIVHYYAKKLGYRYYYLMEDDYHGIVLRNKENGKLISKKLTLFNELVDEIIDFLNTNDNMYCFGCYPVQNYIGGLSNPKVEKEYEFTVWNGWFCDTEKEIKWTGFFCDMETRNLYANYGKLFFSIYNLMINHQSGTRDVIVGGNKDMYTKYPDGARSYLITSQNQIKTPVVLNKKYKTAITFLYRHPMIIDERWKK